MPIPSCIIKESMRLYFEREHCREVAERLNNPDWCEQVAVQEKIDWFYYYEPELRHRSLWIFFNAVQHAHEYGNDRWGVTVSDDRITLIVGLLDVCALTEHFVWLALDTSDPLFAHDNDAWTVDLVQPNLFFPSLKIGYYNPKNTELWSYIKLGLFRLIEQAAQMPFSNQSTHSRAVMDFLRNEFPYAIPDPAY